MGNILAGVVTLAFGYFLYQLFQVIRAKRKHTGRTKAHGLRALVACLIFIAASGGYSLTPEGKAATRENAASSRLVASSRSVSKQKYSAASKKKAVASSKKQKALAASKKKAEESSKQQAAVSSSQAKAAAESSSQKAALAASQSAEAKRVADQQAAATAASQKAAAAASQAAATKAAQAAKQPAAPAQAAPAATNTQQTVYVTATGKRYHLNPNCRGLNNANHVSATTLAAAQGQGLTLCQYE